MYLSSTAFASLQIAELEGGKKKGTSDYNIDDCVQTMLADLPGFLHYSYHMEVCY